MTSPTLKTEALAYDLPERLIATRPAEPRDRARMLVLHCRADTIEHRRIVDLPGYLEDDDLLVLNNTAVTPARIIGKRVDSGGRVEGLFLQDLGAGRWQVMLKSNGRLRAGMRIELLDESRAPSGYVIELVEREDAEWVVGIDSGTSAQQVLEEVGLTPLPPYILRARGAEPGDDRLDRRWYQTVYADRDRCQSVAAPTAGLHFSTDLLEAIADRGVRRVEVTLHVGAGTFKPIEAETLDGHVMHFEQYEVSEDAQIALRDFRRRRSTAGSGRLIAVGTTTVRTLESLPAELPAEPSAPIKGSTDLLIAPPFDFRYVEGLLTNFHLPQSTLLALVAAKVGLERLLDVYRQAIEREYRFYSYGDAMLILP